MKEVLILSVFLFIVSDCAGTKKWSVKEKLDDKTAIIYMDKNEVKPGDKVEVFYYDCEARINQRSPCPHTRLGIGIVEKIIDKDESVVKFEQGSVVKEGTFVRKI